MTTLDLLVNPHWDGQARSTFGGKISKFLVQPDSSRAVDRRVYVAALLFEIGADRVALNVRIPIGRRDSRLDLLAFFGEDVLLAAYSSNSDAQRNALQLSRHRDALSQTTSGPGVSIRGLLAIETDLEFAGDLKLSLEGWAKACTLNDLRCWSANDLLG